MNTLFVCAATAAIIAAENTGPLEFERERIGDTTYEAA